MRAIINMKHLSLFVLFYFLWWAFIAAGRFAIKSFDDDLLILLSIFFASFAASWVMEEIAPKK